MNRLVARAWLSTQISKEKAVLVQFGEGHASWSVLGDMAAGSIAYCGGVGNDATFEFSLAEKMHLEVYSFDPTPSSIEYMQRENRNRVHFYPWGLLDRDDIVRFHAPIDSTHANWFVNNLHGTEVFFEAQCFTVPTIMQKLGHDHIELLKIDIEGCWGEVLHSMLNSDVFPKIICVEFDSPAPLPRVRKAVRALKGAGYRLVLREKENCVFLRN